MKVARIAAMLLLAAGAQAQDARVLIEVGDKLANGAVLTSLPGRVVVNDRGDWLVEGRFSSPKRRAWIVNGTPVLFNGQTLPGHPDVVELRFTPQLDEQGKAYGHDYFALYRQDHVLLAKGDPCTAAGVPVGSTYYRFGDFVVANSRLALVRVVLDTGSDVLVALIRLRLDAAGMVIAQELVGLEGQPVPGDSRPVVRFNHEELDFDKPGFLDMDEEGRPLFWAQLKGNDWRRRTIFLDGQILARDNTPSPWPGTTWRFYRWMSIAQASGLHWAIQAGVLTEFDPPGGLESIVANSEGRYWAVGHPMAGVGTFDAFAPTLWVAAGARGETVFVAEWSVGPKLRRSLFLSDGEVLREWKSRIEGRRVMKLPYPDANGNYLPIDLSPNGELLCVQVELETPAGSNPALVMLEPAAGRLVCEGAPNSTGASASLRGSGGVLASNLALVLRGQRLPPASWTVLVAGPHEDHLPFGQGTLCVGTPRFAAAQGFTDTAGTVALDFDPALAPPGMVAAGQSLVFQLIYRDGANLNTSDAVRVLFH